PHAASPPAPPPPSSTSTAPPQPATPPNQPHPTPPSTDHQHHTPDPWNPAHPADRRATTMPPNENHAPYTTKRSQLAHGRPTNSLISLALPQDRLPRSHSPKRWGVDDSRQHHHYTVRWRSNEMSSLPATWQSLDNNRQFVT